MTERRERIRAEETATGDHPALGLLMLLLSPFAILLDKNPALEFFIPYCKDCRRDAKLRPGTIGKDDGTMQLIVHPEFARRVEAQR